MVTTQTKKSFYHDVLLEFLHRTPSEKINNMFQQVQELKNKIPEIKEVYVYKKECDLEGKRYDGMFRMIFNNEEDEEKYQTHKEHKKVSKLILEISSKVKVKDYYLSN